MSYNETETKQSRANWPFIAIVVGIAAVFLCVCLITTGFAVFQISEQDASAFIPETNTVYVEVTRVVTVVIEPTAVEDEVDGDTAVDPEASETAVENAQAGDTTASEETTPVPKQPAPETESFPEENPPERPPVTDVDIENADLQVLYEVWEIIEQEFDGQLPEDEDLLYALIEGSLETLDDDYTRYIEPEVAARLREDMGGSVSGIGAWVRENDDGFFEIVAPIDGQPADLIGLLPGDLIVAVDGESIIGQSFDEVILKVRGPEGTAVDLTIEREGEDEPLEFTIVRANFEVPVTDAEMLPDNIGYVRLLEFNRNATEKLTEDVNELFAQGAEALILDLRNNPGGYLDQSVSVADLFLPESVVLYERNNQGMDQTFVSDDGDMAETIPMVVLVNRASASASEIVAGALRDNGRAVLIGELTFGKGSVQQIHTLSDGSELRVTVARWYTPDNVSISEEGITPDIEVESPVDFTFGEEDDVQLKRAIEYLLNGE